MPHSDPIIPILAQCATTVHSTDLEENDDTIDWNSMSTRTPNRDGSLVSNRTTIRYAL